MIWSYGVTTVPARFGDLLPRTLKSLADAGFDNPHIFIDDCQTPPESLAMYATTCSCPRLRTAAHWYLSAVHLYLLQPHAERYAIFQDDLVTYKNLREFLEANPMPKKSYLNLYTFPANEHGKGWHMSNQRGLGAVALVFDNEGLRLLLASPHLVNRPMDERRGHHSIDGGIVESMRKVYYKEWVHSPTLVQHTGVNSSMGNRKHPQAVSFLGEDFDAKKLLVGEYYDARRSLFQ